MRNVRFFCQYWMYRICLNLRYTIIWTSTKILTQAEERWGLESVHCPGDGSGWLSTVVLVVPLVVVVIVTTGGCATADGGGSISHAAAIHHGAAVESGHLHDGDGEEARCAEEDDCLVHGCGWLVDRTEQVTILPSIRPFIYSPASLQQTIVT